jgi:signal transduction histidine kinase
LSSERLQRHSLLSFFELSKELDHSLNVYDFADRALFNFMGHLGTPRSALWLLPAEDNAGIVLVRSHGIAEDVARRIGAQCVEALAERMMRHRKLMFVSELEHELESGALELVREREIDILAPLLAPDKLLGIVALGRRLGPAPVYDHFELEVLQASIEFFSVALENSMFFQRIQETNRELRQANKDLEELDHAKTEFVSNMQHELRTPVTVMQMYLESVLEELAPNSEHREHLEIVLKHADKLKRMLVDLLDFSSLSRRRLEVETSPGDVAAVLRSYFEKRRNGVALKLHDFRLAVDPSLPRALFEKKRLSQVLDILLDNAVRFTPQGAQIVLRAGTQRDDDRTRVRIEVEDNGPGIPEKQLAQLFVPFQQGDGSVTRENNGLGLGLALAHRLVEAMGAKIVASSRVGRGTTLTILLNTAP